jgi:hypothetical protein
MGTTATLESTAVKVEPGEEVTVPLTVGNDSDIVEEYHVMVVGPLEDWASAEPETFSVFPGDSQTVAVSFRPPRTSELVAGEYSYGIQIVPTERPEDTVVPEGTLDVLPFDSTTAEILPRTTRGRRGSRHQVAIDNRGNRSVALTLAGADTADLLDVVPRDKDVSADPGTAEFVDVKVRPRRIFWRGASVTHPFTVSVIPEEAPAMELAGTHLQEPVLPAWFFKALLAALMLVLALVALWFLVIRQEVRSAAQEAVQEPVAQANENAAKAATRADDAITAARSANDSAVEAGKAAQKAEEIAGSATPTVEAIEAPVVTRLAVAAPAGGADSATLAKSPDASLAITDLVLSNPQGDFGRMAIKVDGDVVLEVALENFRDLDFHFLTPIRVDENQALELTLTCHEVGSPPAQEPPAQCTSAASINGLSSVQPPPTTPPPPASEPSPTAPPASAPEPTQ